ncbi:MAG TPA: hypothetical protein VGJ09_14045 [Bryobacteraceae bacterium]
MLVAAGIGGLAIAVATCIMVFLFRASRGQAIPVAIGIVVVMAVQFALASAGVLAEWDRRPAPIIVVLGLSVMLTVALALSPIGRRLAEGLPLAALIGFQAFRFPLELVLHRAAATGLMPVQMSFNGDNFDILTGVLAIPVAWLAWKNRAPRALVVGWNLLGSTLLLVIVAIAMASTPVVAAFGPDRLNTFIADAPYVWLPGVLVPSALLGHLLLWRKTARQARFPC